MGHEIGDHYVRVKDKKSSALPPGNDPHGMKKTSRNTRKYECTRCGKEIDGDKGMDYFRELECE